MSPTALAIWAGIIRQLIIAASGALVVYGVKLDDSNIEWITGTLLAIGTGLYSGWKKKQLHGALADAKAACPDAPAK
jgi:hypothetical protein